MGSLFTKQSPQLKQKESTIDPSLYLLGTPRSSPTEKSFYRSSNHFDSNRLHFIPDSERQWNSPLPRTTSFIQRPPTTSNFRTSSVQFDERDSLNNMPTELKYKCDQCGMVFPSNDALFRHKTRFCIGVQDSGIGRKPIYSDDDDEEIDVNNRHNNYHHKQSTVKKVVRHHSPIQKKHEEINDWKRQRSILQTVEDMEDRILIDTHRTQKLNDNIKKQDHIYNEILLEYERLQTQERDVLYQMYNLRNQPTSSNYSVEQLRQMNDITNVNKMPFEDLQRRNIRLERERRIIQQKLEELISTNYQPSAVSNYQPYKLLREMKEQQELNEKALSFLRGRFLNPDSSSSTVSDIPTLPYVNTRYTRLRQTGVNNARNFRHNYLQTSDQDASVIARYTDLDFRLRSYEDYPWTKDYPEPLKQYRYQTDRPIDTTNERLKLANGENQRLQIELDEMHRKFETLDTRTKQLETSMATNLMSNSIDHQRQLSSKTNPYSMSQISARESHPEQIDQRQNNYQTSLPPLEKRVTPRASPAMSLLTSNMNKLRDPLAPQSYDPSGGFVIFFDFLVCLPSATEGCCLVTCLYHPKSGLGEPSQLDPFKCDSYTDERSGERMKVALIGMKQPVPRCPPQQALTVVIEVQTTTNKDLSDDELQTNAWTKLPLFDHKNRLLSGRWKVPLKALPIQHAESLAVINSLPTYERAELHYRLVNSQDGDDQSNAPLSPSFRDLYTYPLQYRNRPPM